MFFTLVGAFFAIHLAVFIAITPSPDTGVSPWNFGGYSYPNYPNAKIGNIYSGPTMCSKTCYFIKKKIMLHKNENSSRLQSCMFVIDNNVSLCLHVLHAYTCNSVIISVITIIIEMIVVPPTVKFNDTHIRFSNRYQSAITNLMTAADLCESTYNKGGLYNCTVCEALVQQRLIACSQYAGYII